MRQARQWLFWTHLVSGIITGLLILFFAITGSLLAYERQIVASADSAYAVRPTGERLPLTKAIARAPRPIRSIAVHSAPESPIELTVGRRDVYLVNPYTGDVAGPASPRVRNFFAQITSLHRWFGLEDTHRTATSAVKGVAVLAFVYLVLSGAALWLPRRWTRRAVRAGVVPRVTGSLRARFVNWHKVAGLWAALPLFVIATTGVVMAYPWANALLFRAAGSPVPRPVSRTEPVDRGAGGSFPRQARDGIDMDAAFREVERVAGTWESITLRMPQGDGAGPLVFNVDRSRGGHPQAREQIIVLPSGDRLMALKREPFSAQTRGQQWRAWVRFSHTGEAGGVAGETVALGAALAASFLVLSGFWLSLDRARTRLHAARRHHAGGLREASR